MCAARLVASALLSVPLAVPGRAADYYVGVDGKPETAGTKAAPWDIGSALGGKQEVEPGDTVWLKGRR